MRGIQFLSHLQSGLPIILGVYLPLNLFIWLAIVTQAYPEGLPWELPLLIQVHRLARPELDTIVQGLSNLGVYWGVVPAAIGLSVVLLWRQQWRSLLYFSLTLLGNMAMNRTAKWLFHRERPHLWEGISPEHGFAFPSGHAMSSMTLVAAVILLAIGSCWFWPALISGSAFVVMIAWTRLYLGVHYPSDIVAGWTLSLAWTIGLGMLVLSQQSIAPELERSRLPTADNSQ